MTKSLSRRDLQLYVDELLIAEDAHVALNNYQNSYIDQLKTYIHQIHVFYCAIICITAALSYTAGVFALNLTKYL